MIIYGVCISDINEINEEKAIEFLEELSEIGYEDYLENFLDNKHDNGEDYTFNDWVYDYHSDFYNIGLAAFLADVIEEVEDIDITSDDPNGVHYLGLSADAPWCFNKKTRNISREDYEDILRKYVCAITNEILEIRWWYVSDDCDW